MPIPLVLIQLAVLVIFGISAYRSISSFSRKDYVDFLFYIAVAIVALAYIF